MAKFFEEYNEEALRAKVSAGFKGGPFFQSPSLAPAKTFVDGVPAEVSEKMGAGKIEQMPIGDAWKDRR